MKKIAIISVYEKMAQIVVPENVALASENNFNGDNLEERTISEIVEDIQKLTPESIKQIVEGNYKYAYEELNINKNLYLIEKPEEKTCQIDINTAITSIVDLERNFIDNLEYTDKVYKDCKENQKWFEQLLENKEKELEIKQKEIDGKMDDMEAVLKNITRDIYEDEEDFEIICPYCNNEFDADVDENVTEVICPECENTIELDWGIEEDNNCNGNCSGCNGCGNE